MKKRELFKRYYLYFIFAILAVVIIVIGRKVIDTEQAKLKQIWQNELISIANLKIDQISEWYRDELLDAKLISQEFSLNQTVEKWLDNEDAESELKLTTLLESLTREHDYSSIFLISKDLDFLISTDKEEIWIDSTIAVYAKLSLKEKNVYATDLYRCKQHQDIHFDIIAPILDLHGNSIALIGFRIDPEKFLYPLIQKWPIESKTAETVLVRAKTDGILFVNELRHQKNSALNLSLSYNRKDVPAVYAALGNKGVFEGVDYRNVQVLSYVDSVPGTPWYIVSKIDKDELEARSKGETNKLLGLITSIFVLLILLVAFLFTIAKKNTYKLLWQTHEEFKTTLYSIGDAVITTDGFGNVKNMNPIAERLTGWQESDAFMQPVERIFNIIDEYTQETVINPVRRVLDASVIIGMNNHTILISKSGDKIPIADSAAPIFNKYNKPDGVVLVFRDQTEENKSREAVLESKRQLSTLMSNLPGMAYRCSNDLEWTMEYVSKGCYELTGYTNFEFENNYHVSYGSIIDPEDQVRVWETVQSALLNRISYQVEYRIRHKSGKLVWVWERGQGIFNEEGNLLALEGFINDVSERKTMIEALRESEEIFDHFMEYSPFYVFFKDENIRSMRLSKNYEKMLGKPLSELLGKNMDELFPSDLAKNMIAIDQEILRQGKVVTVDEELNNRQYHTIKFPVLIDGKARYLAGFTLDITEQKIFENALKASEQLFQTLAENSSVGIFRTDINGATTYVNPKWCELAESSPAEALQGKWYKKLHPEEQEVLVANWENAVRQKSRSIVEYRFVHNDGQVIWVKGDAVPELNEKGELVGYIGTITDITESKRSEEQLVNSNTLLRTIIDNIPDAVYMKDLKGRKLISNSADLKNIGAKSEAEVINKTDFELFPPESAARFWADDLAILESGIPIINREEKLVNHLGKVKWLWTSKIPFRNKEGKIIGLVGIGHDITRRKLEQEEMRQLSTAVTQSPVSIVITDIDSNIVYVNPQFTQITGYTFDEVKGKNPRILKSGKQPDEFYSNMWKELTSGKSWKSEIQNKKKSGELYWENATISPIINEQGEVVNYVAIKEDVTQRKVMLQELILAKEKAEESDRLKTSFLANMSHEIRTPLNSILGFTSFLTTDEDLSVAEKSEFADIINKSADGLLQIINDIIDISSLETGQLKMAMRLFNPNRTLESVLTIFANRLIELKGTEIDLRKLTFDKELFVYTDENRLMQIFNNLIGNALKFTKRGFIEFGIEKVENGFVHFKVEDTGTGIAAEIQTVIFERFRQGEDTINRNYGGNGLGLSIVKNLIELMGGEITLESELGKGSVFRFTLPEATKA